MVRANMMFGFETPGSAAELTPLSEKLLCSFVEKMVTAGAFQNVAPGSSNSGEKPTFLDDQLDYVQSMMKVNDDDDFKYCRPEFIRRYKRMRRRRR